MKINEVNDNDVVLATIKTDKDFVEPEGQAVEVVEITIDVTKVVFCDICFTEFTKSDKKGGFILDAKNVCPDCSPFQMREIRRDKREQHITATCPPGIAFADFIRARRQKLKEDAKL